MLLWLCSCLYWSHWNAIKDRKWIALNELCVPHEGQFVDRHRIKFVFCNMQHAHWRDKIIHLLHYPVSGFKAKSVLWLYVRPQREAQLSSETTRSSVWSGRTVEVGLVVCLNQADVCWCCWLLTLIHRQTTG